ncbi:DUF4224 domain-containing protein [Collimonas rhizosphaerae]|uniref:DUF4224 domain-containing protein n=1 Tax=Collimonas rhizosphaerae TaxID=3126357 RepID=UPI003CCC4FF2
MKIPPPYLTEAEIREIVAPLRQPAAIVRWFRNSGFDVTVRPNGMPLITRSNFDAVTGGIATTTRTQPHGEAPDVAGYLKSLSKRTQQKLSQQKA